MELKEYFEMVGSETVLLPGEEKPRKITETLVKKYAANKEAGRQTVLERYRKRKGIAVVVKTESETKK